MEQYLLHQPGFFQSNFLKKIEADGADIAPSSYILDDIVFEWNKEIETISLFPLFHSNIK